MNKNGPAPEMSVRRRPADLQQPLLFHLQYYRGFLTQDDPGFGYLPSKETDWKQYAPYNKETKTVSVNTTCMYSPFIRFIKGDWARISELPGFYEWFAGVIGFINKESMFENEKFKEMFNQFRADTEASVENRNNASHGGNKISKDQCKADREAILSDLSRIREVNLGLIQQLMSIMNFKAISE